MRETRNLEYKESVTNTFLKTVSAYANFGTGEILFGVADDGTVKGLADLKQTCMDIENRINDSLEPVPAYTLEVLEKTGVIRLTVQEGLHKPYLYKSKAYRRSDSATIEVDRVELTRLILEGEDSSYEELPARSQDLRFEKLTEKLRQILKVETVSTDTLKTLELYREPQGINIAGELFADENSFCGTDLVRFGSSINVILDRETYVHQSVLDQYDGALRLYRKYYQYEQIRGALREAVSLIPEEAFREAIANALVHRTWDVEANINVAMFPDRVEITSPGGLPKGMHEEEYYRGGISILRNRIIGNLFFRLNMVERFGTGIRRIMESYALSSVKPAFRVLDNSIQIILPVMQDPNNLSEDENRLLSLLKGRKKSSSALAAETGFCKTKVLNLLKVLMEKGHIHTEGSGRGLRYTAD